MHTTLTIKQGSELTLEEFSTFSKAEMDNFHKVNVWSENNREKINNYTVFLLKDDGKIVSIAVLEPLKTDFNNKSYNIFGLSSVFSLVKGQGFGKALMQEIIKYANEKKKTIVGFCERKNEGFYKKSGFDVLRDGVSKFIYIDEKGGAHPDSGDAILLNGEDNLIEELKQHPELKVSHYIPHW